MAVSDYSTTAGDNTSLAPEGQTPASVNDGIRQIQADIRALANDFGWFSYGDGAGTPAYTYVAATQFSVANSTSLTSVYHTARRVRAVGATTGTIYGSISASSHSAGVTTVTVVWDSGSLQNETLTISLGEPRVGITTPYANTTQIAAGTSGTGFLLPEKVADLTSKADPGYIRYPGGMILQGGTNTTDGSGLRTVSLAFGVTTANFPVVTAVISQFATVRLLTNTVNNFQVFSVDLAGTAKASVPFTWFSMGY